MDTPEEHAKSELKSVFTPLETGRDDFRNLLQRGGFLNDTKRGG